MNDKSTFDKDFFAQDQAASKSNLNRVMGGGGMWLLHGVKIFLIAYSAYHGIHAAMIYAGESPGAAIFQILGFLVIELTILGLYVSWINKMILGVAQRIAAFSVWAICFALAMAAVVVDSQLTLNGIEALSRSAEMYLNWVLPMAPFVAGAGGALVHSLDPENLAQQAQEKSHAEHNRNLSNSHFIANIRTQEAELEVQKTVKNMQLGSRLYVANALHEAVKHPDPIRQLQEQALRDLPMLLNSAGIDTAQYRVGSANPLTLPAADANTFNGEFNIIDMANEIQQEATPEPVRFHRDDATEGKPTPVSNSAENDGFTLIG